MSRSRPLRAFRALFLGLLAGLCAACASPGPAPGEAEAAQGESEARQVDLFYATDRAPSAVGEEHFSGKRGEMGFGLAAVGIPPGHRMGRHEKPSVFKFEWSADERKHIAVRGVSPLGIEEFYERLASSVAESPDASLMVFVHGYNAAFAQAAQVVAQFTTDLKFPGPVLLYSWPSQGSLTGYKVDENNAEWSQSHFAQVLGDLLDQTGARRIYLVGHSMGTRVVTRGYNALAALRGSAGGMERIVEMVLVAPDIDADLFRKDIAPELARHGIPVTVYASSADRALIASKAFNGYPRAGDSGERLVVVPGVETVDASDAAGGLLGHSYFAEDRRIMEDIFAIVRTGQRADDRFGLQAVDGPEGRYWTFRQ